MTTLQQPAKETGKLHHKLGIFAAVPITLLQDRRLNEKALRAYLALASYEGSKENSYPSLPKISERAGLSLRATSEATKILRNAGWLQVKRRGRGLTNTYSCLAYSEQLPSFDLQIIGKSRLADHRQARFAGLRQINEKTNEKPAGSEPLTAPIPAAGQMNELASSKPAAAGALLGGAASAASFETKAKPEPFIKDPEKIAARELRKRQLAEQAALLAETG
jgi:hypothetical protein